MIMVNKDIKNYFEIIQEIKANFLTSHPSLTIQTQTYSTRGCNIKRVQVRVKYMV